MKKFIYIIVLFLCMTKCPIAENPTNRSEIRTTEGCNLLMLLMTVSQEPVSQRDFIITYYGCIQGVKRDQEEVNKNDQYPWTN